MERLTDQQIEERLSTAAGWVRTDEKWIERKYRFKAFMDGIAFVNKVAERSEQHDHHPLIAIDYKLVTLRLSSWNAGGLTDLDLQMAQEFNELFEQQKQ
ncbi:4a-hydroxytetrahydrobiopterin dehydratase [Brevibacillus humidisoli]|uniref:4a-hydroxytetrahydrobiopterin dehydratase n=1 Tax=Brevibacillus humidisoli TaxID=2895522 RepID=UPI001E434032|nr:4a-hydroxytetrahydrobiopterin dehydratase [Brevibacillus humidisoli]UFJ39326.1 4a-hydroxytetrahydrobiopterin dehydratase [Brevibacillus humidisoli]